MKMDEKVETKTGEVAEGTPTGPIADAELFAEEFSEQDERVTEAKSSVGIYYLGGGFVDADGNLHQEVVPEEMDGFVEDMLGNDSIPGVRRMNELMIRCTTRVGTIIDKKLLPLVIQELPVGDRTALTIYVRRVTHGDIYKMSVTCPLTLRNGKRCDHQDVYEVDLSTLEVFPMPTPRQRLYTVTGPRTKRVMVWHVATGHFEEALERIGELSEYEMLTYTIMTRLQELDGRDVRLYPEDIYDAANSKLKLSKRGKQLYDEVRAMKSSDRDALREDFFAKEPGIDTELEFTCKGCRGEFKGGLDVFQPGFFFPSVISKRLRRK
jgi:hypothetical protein